MLTRKRGERLYVGEIEIIVSEIGKSNVRLAVRAPAGSQVLRGEVKDSIEAQNRAAASSTPVATARAEGAEQRPAPKASPQDLLAFAGKKS